jgi:hypothetical protein
MQATPEEISTLAIKAWGDVNAHFSTRDDLRFGAKGSKSIKPKEGVWFDHEAGEGGGYRELYRKVHGADPPNDADRGTAYDYRDAEGTLLFQVVRKIPKGFYQRRPDGKGGWINETRGIKRALYRLPELLAADPAKPVFVTEGEKDADNLRALGLIVTTNPGGAGKWREELSAHLASRDCIILPDNDDAGREHAASVRDSLSRVARSVRTITLPGLGPKGDVSDWIAAGGTAEGLRALLREPEATPGPKPNGRQAADLPLVFFGDMEPVLSSDDFVEGLLTSASLCATASRARARHSLRSTLPSTLRQGARGGGRMWKGAGCFTAPWKVVTASAIVWWPRDGSINFLPTSSLRQSSPVSTCGPWKPTHRG